MHRAPYLDLAYTHEMLVASIKPDPAASTSQEARDLVARLRCLKALMDAERDVEPAPLDANQQRRTAH